MKIFTGKITGLMRKIEEKIMDMKISFKIRFLYLSLLVISVLISSILYQRIYNNAISGKLSESSMETLYSINQNINTMIDNTSTYSRIILSNTDIQSSLSKKDLFTDPTAIRNLGNNLQGFIEAVPVISSIYLFDNNDNKYIFDKDQTKTLTVDKASKAPWYDEVMDKKGGYILSLNAGGVIQDKNNENCMSLIRVINHMYTQVPIGILILNISQENFADTYQMLISNYDTNVMLLDENNNNLVNENSMEGLDIKALVGKTGGSDQKTFIEKINNTQYLVSYLKMKNQDWKIISIMPLSQLLKDTKFINVIAVIIFAINSILLFIGSLFISNMITRPINKLLISMKGVENSQFKEVDIKAGKDEIGRLQDGYNMMISRMRNLLDKVVEEQKVKRKAELNTLLAQVKPHFLYNTFDAIRSLVLSERNKEVYDAMTALANFYRTSLSRGSEIISINQEVDTVKNYLKIQKVRYGNIFTDYYEIEKAAGEQKIPKLVLQPLVENALYHGIKPKGESGEIRISAKLEDNLIKVVVEDNGVGMSKTELDTAINGRLDNNENGFGLRGTIERLRIYYNTPDIYCIESERGKGTKIIISIPLEGGNN